MAKIAKISLTADVKDFKKGIKEAQKSLMDMSEIKIAPKVSAEFEKKLKKDLVEAQGNLTSKIEETAKALEEMGKKGVNVYDDLDAQDLIKKHAEYNDKLKETKKLLDEIGRADAPPSPDVGATTGRSAGKGMMGIGKGIAGMAGAVGLGLGAGALFQGAQTQARERSRISAMTGVSYVDEESKLGFTRAERREPRGRRIAGAMGRNITNAQLNEQINLGEQMERAYGIGAETQVGMVGAARRGGVEGSEKKFITDALGGALAAKLEGGAIGEYLSSMTDYMKEMSKGINIDGSSLRGISGALADLPFFKQDPTRIFDALQGIDKMFKGGDRFQEAMVMKSIGQAAGGQINPAAISIRKDMDLFGKLGEEVTEEELVKKGYSEAAAATMTAKGEDILTNIFNNVIKTGKGRTREAQLQRFGTAVNMKPGQAYSTFEAIAEKRLTPEMIEEFSKSYGKSTEEIMQDRLKSTYDAFAKSVLGAAVRIDEAIERMEKNIGKPIGQLVTTINDEIVSLDKLGHAIMALTTVMTIKGFVEGAGLLGVGATAAGAAGGAAGATAAGAGAVAGGAIAAGAAALMYPTSGGDAKELDKLDQYKKMNPNASEGFKSGMLGTGMHKILDPKWSDAADYSSTFGGMDLTPGKNGGPQAAEPQLRGGNKDGIEATVNLTTMQERAIIALENNTDAIRSAGGGSGISGPRMNNRVSSIPPHRRVGK